MIRRHLRSNVPVAPASCDRLADHPRPRRRRTSLASATVALAVAASLSACQWTSTVQTDQAYEPADGTSVEVGPVSFHDLLVVAPQQGGPGTIVGMVANNSASPATVSVSLQQQDGASEPATAQPLVVPAWGTAHLTDSGQGGASIDSVPKPPGAMVMLQVQAPSGVTVANVPVLAPQGPYASLGPTGAPTGTGAAGQATPTQTPTPTPTSTSG